VPIRVSRLNHAVLFVRDLEVAVDFYRRVFGFREVAREFGGRMSLLRAADGENHHDLGLLALGPAAPRPPRGATGLYHLAWEVPSIEDLAEALRVLEAEGALVGASDHGVSKSVYGRDPDGNEFEIMWRVPPKDWGPYAERGVVLPLDLEAELARYGGGGGPA
jgi:catechol-2,3-dioxygenase